MRSPPTLGESDEAHGDNADVAPDLGCNGRVFGLRARPRSITILLNANDWPVGPKETSKELDYSDPGQGACRNLNRTARFTQITETQRLAASGCPVGSREGLARRHP
jgi:hypothetical protein